MTLQELAKAKLQELEAQKIGLNLPQEDFNSKIAWLRRISSGEDLESDQETNNVNKKREPKYPLFIDLPKLLHLSTATYDLAELKSLCFELGIDFENLGGTTKEEKFIEYISMLNRTGKILGLIISISRKNKSISWEDFI